MADRTTNPTTQQRQRTTTTATTQTVPSSPAVQNTHVSTFLRKIQSHAPNSSQLMGFLTLIISGSILLLLTGLTVTVTVTGLIFFAPLIIVSSPIWFPVTVVLFFSVAGFLSVCGFFAATVGGLYWMYKYYKGMNPPGSDRFDYARSRIYDTATHVKDYAREYGGYLQSKVKDAAPGA